MKIKTSKSHADAAIQIASNSVLYRSGLYILERGAKKWQIVKTLVYISPNGMHSVYWIDSNGDCVYYLLIGIEGSYPIIGKLEYTSEMITVL